jgi:2-isopropylmalate synthase
MGIDVQANKAIVGENAFAHSSGIHQDGLLKSREAYEIIHPDDVGAEGMELVLTARSGRHAVKNGLATLGWNTFSQDEFEQIFREFLKLADLKKEIYLFDLYFLVEKFFAKQGRKESGAPPVANSLFELVDYLTISNSTLPSASVHLRKGTEEIKHSSSGDGPIDALYTSIRRATGISAKLLEYRIQSISRGKEAPGKVSLRLEHEGETYASRAMDTDVIRASALAYINGVNQIVLEQFKKEKSISDS